MTKIRHDENIDICGTSLMGEFECDYSLLKRLFGNPCKGDEYKIDAQWCLKFPCGTIATIYNYKDGKNYLGRDGLPKTKLTKWHIGGRSEKAVKVVLDYVLNNKGD